MAKWKQEGLCDFPISINISAAQFEYPEFPDKVSIALKTFDMPASSLELEITEEFAHNDITKVISTISGLKQIGVMLAINDFGTSVPV